MILAKPTKLKVAKKQNNNVGLLSIKRGQIDYVFLLLLVLVLIAGMLSLYTASFASALTQYGDSYRFISRQVIYGVGGIVLMLFISTINYQIYNKLVWPMYVVTLVLLALVFNYPRINGAHRWIIIAESITFQPSEIAKFVVVILFAHLITLNYDKINDLKKGLIPLMVFLAPIVLLVVAEPHLSATLLILGIAAVMLFVGGLDIRWFIMLGVIAIVGIWLLINTDIISYGKDRIAVWLNPEADPRGDGYQTLQSLYAIGSGGLGGKGIGGSTQKYNQKLPELQNDYIFAIVCEELGWIGASAIIILFALLVWRGILVAIRCPDKFGSLVAIGLIAQVGLQVMFNIAVITNTVPPTGVSLPFFSAGGTSLIMLLMQMGVLLSVSRRPKENIN